MGIPVVAVILVFLHDSVQVITVSSVCSSLVYFSGADSLIVDLDIFYLSASLVNFEDAVRVVFTGEGESLLVVLN